MTKVTSENVLVDSSLVKHMHYINDTKNLYVTFSNGTIYRYSNVDSETYQDVRNSDSIGKALHKKIFNVYEYRKI